MNRFCTKSKAQTPQGQMEAESLVTHEGGTFLRLATTSPSILNMSYADGKLQLIIPDGEDAIEVLDALEEVISKTRQELIQRLSNQSK